MVSAALSVLSFVAATTAEFTVVSHVSTAPRSIVPAVIPPAEFVVPITGKSPRRQTKKDALSALRSHASKNNTAVLAGADLDQEYLTDITIGGQTFTAIVDTGSSDTWLIKKGFNCFNLSSFPEPQATCGFGSDGFDTKASTTFQEFPNVSFNISYGDGEFLSGPVGFDTVSVGGLTVTKQEVGTPDFAAWNGDGVNSGLLGLAYSTITSVYNTTDPTKASSANHIPYDPFFVTAFKQGVVTNPYFSIALDRGALFVNTSTDPNLGYLAFGGMPPVALDKTAVTVPIQKYSAKTGDPSSAAGAEYIYYTIDVESYVFPGSTSVATANNNTIVDSGTTLNYVPDKVAKAYNAKFVPKATLDSDSGLYFVNCNATAPAFSVTLAGKSFPVDARDQILDAGTDDSGNVLCISGTQPGGADTAGTVFILGDVFLHNVVGTFNVQTNELTVTRRTKY
ncbi:aspartic peptidase domain-containing protein [Mycena metata]|uniref:Aspartic peptidase domain-containing protein n=1 Tax=Mycena metata TaxID=1033252 RepID=A0AAD7NVV2_9AGAR|nr:aspartic peptidase domain-containing protein [Mycena metata]